MTNERNIPQEVKEKLDIIEIIERYVKLRKIGKNYTGNCPFHSEKTPSFMVNPDIQRYKCYGCDKSGDVLTFVQEIENLDFPETLKKLAKEAGVEYEQTKRNNKFVVFEKINEEATKFFQKSLLTNTEAIAYLKGRGLIEESINDFKIGFAPGRNLLLQHLLNAKFSRKSLEESGLFSLKNGQLKDKFINRVMFPIWSPFGKIVGFSGRNLPNNDFGPKYMNTPETPIFKKGQTLFGYYQSKPGIRKENYVILCEGQIDVISAFAIGIKNIVAPLGTGLTEDQLQLIKKSTDRLLVFFDNDQAGQKALTRAFLLATKQGFKVFAVNPEPHQDLDELIQEDKELALKKIVPKIDAYTYLLSHRLADIDLNSLDGVSIITTLHYTLTENVQNEQEKQYYTKMFKFLTKIDLKQPQTAKTLQRKESQVTKTKSKLSDEEYFLLLIIKYGQYSKVKTLNLQHFRDQAVLEILTKLQTVSCETTDDLMELNGLSDQSNAKLEELIFRMDEPLNLVKTEKELNEVFLRIKIDDLKAKRQDHGTKIAIAEAQEDQDSIDFHTNEYTKLTLKIIEANEQISRLR